MKTSQRILLLALGTTLAFTVTGCKHQAYNTPLNGASATGSATPGIGDGQAIAGTGPIETGGGNTAEFDPSQYNEDRAALAAHTVHFDYDSATIRPSEAANIAAVAAALTSDGSAKLMIEGYCDERGTEEYNRSLGERRALALREAVAKGGVDPNRIRTISYGEDRPAAPGHDEAAWSQNRRGEFVLLHPK